MNRRLGIAYIVVALVLAACAQINPLTGGVKDQYAPKIDSSGTYPLSGQTNFQSDKIVIKFQEYIKLNNPNDNIIVTPQLKNKPEVTVKNKKLTLQFNEELKANTTYTISFNHAVADITEKNDSIFQFVFSTGNFIDSLTYNGRVIDAFTNKPQEGYLVGLYDANTATEFDSIPFKDRPVYIAQTAANGNFKMNYLKGDDYFLFAIDDENKNLKLDPIENRGFIAEKKVSIGLENESPLMLTFDVVPTEVKLKTTSFSYPGQVNFVFSGTPNEFKVATELELIEEMTDRADSLLFWTAENPVPKMRFYAELNGVIDTVKALYKGTPDAGKDVFLKVENNLRNGELLPNEKLELTFSEPIGANVSGTYHFLSKDSVELEVPTYGIQNLRTIVFDTLMPDVAYVKIDSASISSWYNHTTEKDTWIKVKALAPSYFGTLLLNIDTSFNQPVIVQLLTDKNEVAAEQAFQPQLTFTNLIPGKYQVRLIFDANNDGEWTGGSLKEGRLPEAVLYNKELIDIKSKWEKEVDWIIEK